MESIFGKADIGRQQPANVFDLPHVSADVEVSLIKDGLERKFGHKFQTRVKVDGYLDEMEYRLVMNDYGFTESGDSHCVWGGGVNNVLDLNEAFVSNYWRSISRAREALKNDADLSDFDKEHYGKCIDTAVAGSRSELLLRAVAEGKI